MSSFGRIITLIITIVLLFFLPLQCSQSIEERCQREYIESQLRRIYREVRQEGGWTGEMYQQVVRLAGTTNRRMQYEIVVSKKSAVLQPGEGNTLFWYYKQEFHNDVLCTLNKDGFYPIDQNDALSIRIYETDEKNVQYVFGGI